MFCERCGRLLNRATGRCVCDDNPALAVPPAPPPASAAAEATSPATVATLTREDALAAAREMSSLDLPSRPGGRVHYPVDPEPRRERPAPPRPAPEPPAPAPPPPPLPPLGRLRGTAPDLRAGVAKRFDLRVHDGSLVLHRVPGLDPVLVGRLLGLLLGPLGLILGDAAGRRVARRQRAVRLASAVDEDAGDRIDESQLVAVTLQRLPWGGTLQIGAGGAGGAGGRRVRWSRRDVDTNEIAGLLQATVGRRFSMVPSDGRMDLGHRVAVVLLVLAAFVSVALPAKGILFPPPEPGADLPAAARTALRHACPTWQEAPLAGAPLARAATTVRPDLERAAAASPELAGLPAAIDTIKAFAPRANDPTTPLADAAAFSAAVDTVDGACARVGL